MRPIGALVVAVLCAVAILTPANKATAHPEQSSAPNILVLIADDMGWQDNSIYGAMNVPTPHLEELAEKGVVFETAMLTAPSCSPSRISLISGLYPHQTGAEDMHIPLPEQFKTLPSFLAEKGYHTGHMSKTHYGPYAEAQFDWYAKDIVELPRFLDEGGDKPFFMWIGFNDPHRPYGEGSKDSDADASGLSLADLAVSPDAVTVRPHLADAPGTRREIAAYQTEIRRLDANIGWVIDQLEARGELENTLIVFLSDNGAPFPREKTSLYDAGTRTPLIVSWPAQLPQNERIDGLASAIDFGPTILDAAGIAKPEIMEGSSLLPIMQGKQESTREYAFSERNWHGQDAHMRSVRTKDYKLILNSYVSLAQPYGCCQEYSLWDLLERRDAGELTAQQKLHFRAPRPRVELYYLPDDPDEYVNVAGTAEHGPVADRLAQVLAQWRADTNDFPYWERRREDTSDRETGVLFKGGVPPLIAE